MRKQLKNIKFVVGDLVIKYVVNDETPIIGMVVAVYTEIVHIHWYNVGYETTTVSGKTRAAFQRAAYLEYRKQSSS